ncbi:hypothetical protein CN684_00190 [Bacillus wiedmannii]|uniref:Radical SAM core domain-containing protein n=2 Tax=Bacillus wiedmannii TaxID=1890302 RepID=A0A2C4H6Z6_9BACI|nr:radical SAM protein [Bacillus wiedmannii]PEJ11752.1 hypothetical protein CN684_00190 [Bacillus wiedmannii]PHC62286.1 hypothetical protein COF35_30295 [Bacillus wiedmannii]
MMYNQRNKFNYSENKERGWVITIKLKKEKFNLDSFLNLPNPIVHKVIDDKNLFLAIKVPAWVVLDELESMLMSELINKKTLREAIKSVALRSHLDPIELINVMKKLISTLYSKDFFNKMYEKSDNYVQNVRNLQFHLTNRCNLRCTHCYMNSGIAHYDEISLKEWKEIINQASQRYDSWFLTLTGGEPTLYDGYLEILKYAKAHGATTAMISNGTLLTKRKIDELNGILDHIQISLDGATEEVNDRVRGKGVFKKVVKTFKLLRDTDMRVGMNIVVMKSNTDDLRENLHNLIMDELQGMDVDLDLSSFVSEGRGINLTENVDPVTLTTTISHTAEHFINEDDWMPTPSYPRRNCGYGNTIDVYPNGDVSPCLTPRFIRGNFLKDGITNVFDWIEHGREQSMVDALPECKSCNLRYVCGGRCHLPSLTKGLGILQVSCSDAYKERMYKNLVRQYESTKLDTEIGNPVTTSN